MPINNFYNTGTVSITAGTTGAVGVGTSWLNAVRANDILWINGVDCRVLTVVDNTHVTLAYPWPGLTAAGSLYEIRTPPPTSDLSVTIRTFVAAVASGPINDILNMSFSNGDLLQYVGANLTRIPLLTLYGQLGDSDVTLAANSNTVFPTQAAVKAYVSSFATAAIHWVNACAVATTANITLSGEQTIDGVVTSASRVCVQNQTTTSQNGIYVSAAGAWSRSAETNTGAGLAGATTFINAGTITGKTIKVFTPSVITLGTTGVVVVNAYGPGTYSNGTGISLAANVFSIANNAITYGLFQQVAASSLVGNATGSLANAAGITLGAALAFSGSVLQTVAMTGDVTSSANSFGTTVAKIAGVSVGTPSGNGNVIFSGGTPTFTGTPVLGAPTATSLALGGAALAGAVFGATGNGFFSGNLTLTGTSSVYNLRNGGTVMSSPANATTQLGAADAAAAVAQTLAVQSVLTGTANVAGANWTFIGSLPTGSGLPGDVIFKTGFQGTAANGTVTMTIASPAVATFNGHGYLVNQAIVFTNAGGALPTGVTSGVVYYVIATGLTTNNFQFAATPGGAAINTSGSQSGVHTVTASTTQQAALTALTLKGGSLAAQFIGAISGPSLALGGAALSGNVFAATGSAAISGALTSASLALGGAALSGNALAVTGSGLFSTGLTIGGNFNLTTNASTIALRNSGTFLSSPVNGTWQFGAADAAVAVAQTLGVQNIAGGTSNVSGAAFSVVGSLATGSGTPGDVIFKTGFQGVNSSGTFTVTIASPAVFTRAAHGYSINQGVRLTNVGGALPTGLSIGPTYYIIATGFTTGAFQVAATPGGAAINTTGSQSGTHTVQSADVQQAGVTAFTIKGGTQIVNFVAQINAPTILTTAILVAALPNAATAGVGARAFVTDANATTFNSTVAGGGANKVPVFSDGAAWKIG